MILGYNTNGLAHHELVEAVCLVIEYGYDAVAITIDHHALRPGAEQTRWQLDQIRKLLQRFRTRSVIETGARYLLDRWRKHEPTLVSPNAIGRARRVAFYRHAIDCAATLGSDCVSLWSGALRDEVSEDEAMARLTTGLRQVLDYAAERGVAVGFEPEPGMFIDTMARFEQLLDAMGDDSLRLTLDVGHLQCQGELPLADHIRRWAPRLVNVHLDDAHRGAHEHLMFGEGEIDFPAVFEALRAAGYTGCVNVELSRHSHVGPEAARQAFEFLVPLCSSRSA